MMAAKSAISGSIFRPHFKTHQSAGVGEWFREAGVKAITVSSLSMAEYFADHGWDDITIAIPFNIRESDNLNFLAEKITVNILVDDGRVIKAVDMKISHEIGVFLKIDCGYHRTGIDVDDGMAISKALDAMKSCKHLRFKGFLTHSGATYHASSIDEIRNIHHNTVGKMKRLKQRWNSAFADAIISIGDTPSMSVIDCFSGIDEIRPGNFVFFDLMQKELGVCADEQVAVVVVAPVIGKYPKRNQVVVHCGGVHLSKESLVVDGITIFGKVVFFNEKGWEFPEKDIWVTSLSQEHGTLSIPQGKMRKFDYGSLVGIIPVHSCMTADCFSHYRTTEDEQLYRL